VNQTHNNAINADANKLRCAPLLVSGYAERSPSNKANLASHHECDILSYR